MNLENLFLNRQPIMPRIITTMLVLAAIAFLVAPTFGQSESKQDANGGAGTTQGSDTKMEGSTTKQGSDSKLEGSASNQGSDTKEVVDPAFEQFVKSIQELSDNEKKVKGLVISMPIGFKAQQDAQKAKIAELKKRNQQILNELYPLAIESFEKNPNTQQPVTNYLINQLQLQLAGQNYIISPFNPIASNRLYQKLVDGGVESPVLDLLGYRINYVLHDFEASRVLLIEAAKKGQNAGQPAMEDLRTITGQWNRELQFREMDAKSNNPRVKIEMDGGDMVLELFEDQAPNIVANFISLAESGYYDGLAFYKVGKTEVAISGSPTNDGKGGPDYRIKCECDGENIRHHFTGVISHYPLSKDNGSARFLITKQPQHNLNGKTTVFGRIVEGLENLYKIKIVDRATRNNLSPQQPSIINKITVLRKRDHEYTPEKISSTAPLSPSK